MNYTDDERRSFAEAIRTARQEAGLSLARVAATISTPTRPISAQSVSAWEHGTVPDRLGVILPRLERALDIPAGTLTEALQAPPASFTVTADVEELKRRMADLEDRVGSLEVDRDAPARPRLRAADSGTADDPGAVRDVSATRRRRTSADPDEP